MCQEEGVLLATALCVLSNKKPPVFKLKIHTTKEIQIIITINLIAQIAIIAAEPQ